MPWLLYSVPSLEMIHYTAIDSGNKCIERIIKFSQTWGAKLQGTQASQFCFLLKKLKLLDGYVSILYN